MTQSTLRTSVRRPSANAAVLDISGDITAASEDVLMGAYNDANAERTHSIILNFSSLNYMNSGGIGLLVTLLVRANRQKQKLLAFGLNDHYKQIFELTRLDEAIQILDGEDAAIAAASGPAQQTRRDR